MQSLQVKQCLGACAYRLGKYPKISPLMGWISLRTQTYFRLSLVSAENNVCEPEPGNDFCDVITFVSLWPIRFHDRMKLECSSQRISRAVVLGPLELTVIGLKFLRHRNHLLARVCRRYFRRRQATAGNTSAFAGYDHKGSVK